jgi:hypothetical protein
MRRAILAMMLGLAVVAGAMTMGAPQVGAWESEHPLQAKYVDIDPDGPDYAIQSPSPEAESHSASGQSVVVSAIIEVVEIYIDLLGL